MTPAELDTVRRALESKNGRVARGLEDASAAFVTYDGSAADLNQVAEYVERLERACRALLAAPQAAHPAEPPYRKCQYCGCNTNAVMRACCDRGRREDYSDSVWASERHAAALAAQEPADEHSPTPPRHCKYSGGTCTRRGCAIGCHASSLVAQEPRRPMTEADIGLLSTTPLFSRMHPDFVRECVRTIERHQSITGEPTPDPLQALTDASEKAGLEP